MEYLLKASAVIFIFYLLYKLFLQRETFFHTNRLYLLIGLVTSICIPLIVIPVYIEYVPVTIDNMISIETNVQQNSSELAFDWKQLVHIIYTIGVILFLGKLFMEFTSLRFLLSRHNYYKSDSFTLVETNDSIPPFSFFNWIVYNPNAYSNDELKHILNHEKVHAKELHSIDIIITQLACVLLWFNPFIWLYKKEVQQNLEFIADKKAQNFSQCDKAYQLILLKSSGIAKDKFLITNNFYNSQIKKRIIMLHKSKSGKVNAWKYGLILPVLALFLMSFNTEEVFIEAVSSNHNNETEQTKVSNQINDLNDTVGLLKNSKSKNKEKTKTPKTNKKKGNSLIAQTQPKTITNKTKSISDVSITVIDKNTSDTELDKIKANHKKEGVTIKFKGIKRNGNGEITAIKIEAKSKNSSANYNINSDEAIDPIKIVFDGDDNSISIGNEHKKHGKNTYVYTTNNGGKYKVHKSGSTSNVFMFSDDEHEHEDEYEDEHEHEAKVIIRGKNGKKGKIKKIKSISRVHVISDDHDDTDYEVIIDEDGNHKDKTIIINGKVGDFIEDEDHIIVKGKGKNIWVSKDGDHENVIDIQNDDNNHHIFISSDSGKDPLFIVDGKEISKEKFQEIDSDTIESVNVIKGKSATEIYGKKAKDGVVVVITKKKN